MIRAAKLAAPALAIAALTALGVAGAAPAGAAARTVQTDTFVLTAVGSSRVLDVPRTGGVSAQAVEVDNRTAAPITLSLVAVDAQRSPEGIYGYGAPNAGYAASVHIKSTTVTLAPHAQQIVTVDIDTPKGDGPEQYAAVTATQVVPGQQDLTVQARLAVLVRLAGNAVPANPQALVGHKVTRLPSLPVLVVGGGIGAVGLAGASWLLLVAKRRRRDDKPADTSALTDVTPERELAGV